ncbi:hypothetical protein NHX12_019629 [Muraenolepis orangiensis]|uniref:Uncharacterized protein n=1 Tax=Muraenolepis orangiensis TaxID=630683 RepID=A0A9Q0ETX1_9TELE|nr:hypothetical protein NHX12_019629 [Muraenolepis orangiensis]
MASSSKKVYEVFVSKVPWTVAMRQEDGFPPRLLLGGLHLGGGSDQQPAEGLPCAGGSQGEPWPPGPSGTTS